MKRTFSKTAAAICSLLLTAGIASYFIISVMHPSTLNAADSSNSTLTKVGDKSPVTSVRTVDGKTVDFANKVVVLNFFATWCGPCMMEMPHVQKDLWEPLKSKGLIVIAAGREHSDAEIKAFQEKNRYTFLFAADPKRDIFGKFATQSIPRCVVIGKDGIIKYAEQTPTPKDLPNFAAIQAALGK